MQSKTKQMDLFDDETELSIARARLAFMPLWNQQVYEANARAMNEILRKLPGNAQNSETTSG